MTNDGLLLTVKEMTQGKSIMIMNKKVGVFYLRNNHAATSELGCSFLCDLVESQLCRLWGRARLQRRRKRVMAVAACAHYSAFTSFGRGSSSL